MGVAMTAATAAKVFPCVILLLSIGAACGYFAVGDYRRALYWAAGAIITATVTF